jgi:tetratricopeptide (TPR) repeat protein
MPVAAAAAAIVLIGAAFPASAQFKPERERARIQNRLGWENMKAEAWAAAAKSFQQAIEIDPEFEIAYYGLGRADMALKQYVDAIAAYTKCRDLYRALAGRQFSNAQEAQRYRNNRITEIDEQIRSVQSMPPGAQSADLMRQLQNQKRDLQDSIQRGTTAISIENTVPAYVSLALGSAYFRAQRFEDAEREYKAAITADSKAGEAHNNLAVVYLETGRYEEAEKALKAAEKSGFRVNPMLKEDIIAKKKAKTGQI